MAKEQILNPLAKLTVGTNTDVVISAGLYKGHYRSRIEDLKESEGLVALAHPLMRGALLPVYRDMGFAMVIEDSTAVYEYEMVVSRIDLRTGVAMLWARVEEGPNRIQRRRFLRVDCFWQARLFLLEAENEKAMSGEWYDVHVIDISLGGYRFKGAIPHPIQAGDHLFLHFSLLGKTFFIEGRASRLKKEGVQWDIGVEFVALPAFSEKTLFEYIRQQEMLGRG